MTKTVVNADDFGYSKAVNLGIMETHLNGILTSTTMMANMYGFDHGVKLSEENPLLAIGVHLSLTCGKPVLENMDTLIDKNGDFKSLKIHKENTNLVDLDQLFEEWNAQIIKVVASGINVTHLDSHHYTHSFDRYSEVVESLAKKYDLPVRNCFDIEKKLNNKSVLKTETFWNLFNFPEIKNMDSKYEIVKNNIYELIEKYASIYSKYSKIEAACHPAYMDTDIYFNSSFNIARMREIEILCDPYVKKIFEKYEFEFCNYSDL